MSSFPSSSIGLPVQLKYDLPPSLSDSARSYSVNVSPDGSTQVVGPALPTNVFVLDSTGNFGNFTSQQISFSIPSGMSNSVFLDPASTTLSFSLTYTLSTAVATATATPTTAPSLNLIGSGASFFDTLTFYSNSVPIETVNQHG